MAATARALPAKASTPVHFFGSSAGVFNEIRSGQAIVPLEPVPGLLGIRLYGEYPDSNGNRLAKAWPAGPSPTTQGPMVYSIYPLPETVVPTDPAFQAIQTIIGTAPPRSYLTAWHEALNDNSLTPPGATPDTMMLLHSTLNQMCQGTRSTPVIVVAGCSAVLVPPGTYLVNGTLQMYTGSVLSGASRSSAIIKQWTGERDRVWYLRLDRGGHLSRPGRLSQASPPARRT